MTRKFSLGLPKKIWITIVNICSLTDSWVSHQFLYWSRPVQRLSRKAKKTCVQCTWLFQRDTSTFTQSRHYKSSSKNIALINAPQKFESWLLYNAPHCLKYFMSWYAIIVIKIPFELLWSVGRREIMRQCIVEKSLLSRSIQLPAGLSVMQRYFFNMF